MMQRFVSFASINGKYDEKTGKFAKGSTVNLDRLLMRCGLHELSCEEVIEMIYLQSEDKLFRNSLNIIHLIYIKNLKKAYLVISGCLSKK